MKKNNCVSFKDFSRQETPLACIGEGNLSPLPAPYDSPENIPEFKPLKDQTIERSECTLDNTVALAIPKPASKAEEKLLVEKFIKGVRKLFEKENNWTFLQPLILSMENCTHCTTCGDACHIHESSGNNEIYHPLFRSEILRRIYFKYIKPGNKTIAVWQHGDIDLNWKTISRLLELSYRCNLCRRCAQTCPIGVDNGLIAHEIRKIFSQEMGIHPKELHQNGSLLQIKAGSSTGMTTEVVKDNIKFIDEDSSERLGIDIKTPWDKEGADILLIHNAGEILAWPENHGAFAAIFNAAGVSWTLSSESQEALGYDNINYGLFYDDAMLAKVALKHVKAAKKLGVKRILLGECGHASKALTVIADRILTGDLNIPRMNAMDFLEETVMSGKLKLDPQRNNFPVTLHDPCNLVRLMGVWKPQRNILKKICPQFREMAPHGAENYCCGGGSGFAIMSGNNFEDWKMHVSGRKKMEQIINAFKPEEQEQTPKYVCAPCSNCKGQIRDLISYYQMKDKLNIHYGGLVELIVNAMTDVQPGYIEWDDF